MGSLQMGRIMVLDLTVRVSVRSPVRLFIHFPCVHQSFSCLPVRTFVCPSVVFPPLQKCGTYIAAVNGLGNLVVVVIILINKEVTINQRVSRGYLKVSVHTK